MMVIDDHEGLENNELYNMTEVYKEWFKTFNDNLNIERKKFDPSSVLDKIQKNTKMMEIIEKIDVKKQYSLDFVISKLWPKLELLP